MKVISRCIGGLLGLALCAPSWGTTVANTGGFSFSHTGTVSSGPASLLSSYTNTQTNTASPIAFVKFDASLGVLTKVTVAVNTSTSSFAVSPSGLLSLLSSATATRRLTYTVTAGTTSTSDYNEVTTSGAALLTLLGLGSAEIGGAPLAKTATFTANADLVNFIGAGSASVTLGSSDTLSVGTLLSLSNGAGFQGIGQYAGSVSITYDYVPFAAGDQVSLSVSADKSTITPGATVTYTILFTNQGITPVTTLTVSDQSPPYTSFAATLPVSPPSGLSAPSISTPAVGAKGAVTWTFPGQLAPAASGTVKYSVIVDP